MTGDPFAVVSYEPGAADVINLDGKKLGYVLQDNHGRWRPMRGGVQLTDAFRYRRDAARWLWTYAEELARIAASEEPTP
jgi:hypothetical protein